MNNSFQNYEKKLDFIINNIKNKNKIRKTQNNEVKEQINEEQINEEQINEEQINEEQINEKQINKEQINKEQIKNKKIVKNKNEDKDFYCKQLDSLNYCLEMYKVRKNKKADFDIHSIQKYNIEDEDIDKEEKILNWKDLSETKQEELIKNFIKKTSDKYNLDIEYTEIFIRDNLSKIKYDKYKKKIVDLHGMINCVENNINILKIKKITTKGTNSHINKLRKSLATSKKTRFSVS